MEWSGVVVEGGGREDSVCLYSVSVFFSPCGLRTLSL